MSEPMAAVMDQEGVGKKKGKRVPNCAKKGEKRNPTGKKRQQVLAAPNYPAGLVVKEGETQLEAMRWVLANPKDETFQQWQMRQSLFADRERFLATKLTLERAGWESDGTGSSATSSSTSTESELPCRDRGTEECLRLVRECLERYGVDPERGKPAQSPR